VLPFGIATVTSQRRAPFAMASATSRPPEKPANAVSPCTLTPDGVRTMSEGAAR